ncbi:hypothetical protein [Sporosarcina sp. SG10008]|uniref:hypothetical protein n=1 Tax=Sporosarcina sp. SG10008 TaxID=3373103 RepID=UPI0037DBF0A4
MMSGLTGNPLIMPLENLFSVFESLNSLNEKFEKFGAGEKITFIIIGLILAVPVLLFFTRLLFENNSLTSFDIKLLHKKEHAKFIFGKSISTLILLSVIFFIINLLGMFLVSQITFFEYAVIVIILLCLTIYICVVILLILAWTFNGLKFLFSKMFNRNFAFRPLTINIIISPIKARFPKLIETIIMFFLAIIGSFNMHLLSDSAYMLESVALNIIFTVFLIILQALFLIYILFPKSTKKFILLEVSPTLPEFELILDYYIDDKTSVLNNPDGSRKVIKKLIGETYIYEIYRVSV